MRFNKWSKWRMFPNPKAGEYLYAPFGIGVYDVRNAKTKEHILCGHSKYVAHRLTSLLDKESGGCCGRKNEDKKHHVSTHIDNMEYRTISLETTKDAKKKEDILKKKFSYKYPT